MSTASVETFLLQVNTGKIKTGLARVYRYIRRNERTHKYAIMRDLSMGHQTATARLSGLLDMGVIEVTEIAKVPKIDSKVSRFVVQTDPDKIQENANVREETRNSKIRHKVISICKKSGMTLNEFFSTETISELSA